MYKKKNKIPRIIPRIDIKNSDLVKGVNLEGLRVLGKPEEFSSLYYEEGADELFFQDTVASLYGRNSLHDIIQKTSKNIFIPLAVGGGLRSIKDIENVLKSGADKVSINSAAVRKPNFINQASKEFGSSTIIVSIETIRDSDGTYKVLTDSGRELTRKNTINWSKEIQDRGAGEICLTSITNEGTGKGFDVELFNLLSSSLEIPIIIHGGAGKLNHFKEFGNKIPDGFVISSILHYSYLKKINKKSNFDGNDFFLKSNENFLDFENLRIKKIKQIL